MLETAEIFFRNKTANPVVINLDNKNMDTMEYKTDKERKKDLEERLRQAEKKGKGDNLALARDREDLDAIANEKKENRLIITGLTNPLFLTINHT